ncbi:major facilitator superfamily MFS_1 [Thermaerobacter marianensis DSM 12885]|uniref:Major facilitator superfamily MFS_1 n=1 Tax=Thermaerobacter marianensis (strain ATCC 700841 / DSM 12885 / JCM 10246 / 7p75a) TaxID=644966 RepID=E6SHB6_THEM7|nr:MFS transporter [Thermaerobacter marianensis]ADU50680.1 major facilitator superfamily MFS_1 [Thermaerobacter marianensis DSM 12885]
MKGALGYLLLLSLAHLITDLNQGGMPALLPQLKESYGLTYAQLGVVLLVLNITSSLIQPLFGYWSDKRPQGWLVAAGPLLAAVGLALVGYARSYEGVLLAAILCGIGVALFHPEGARSARGVSGGQRATAMSIFSVGGNLGFALGPVAATAVVGLWGPQGLAWLVLPAGLLAAGMVAALPGMDRLEQATARRGATTPGRMPGTRGPGPAAGSAPAGSSAGSGGGTGPAPADEAGKTNWLAEVLLIGVVGTRSWLQFGVLSLMPFLYLEKAGPHGVSTGVLLFVFLAAGAVGTLVGGPLADRIGTRTVLIGSMAVLIPLHWGLVHGPAWATLPLLAATGFALVATFSITLVMSQDFMPRYVAVASGLNTGFSIGLGGIGAAALGALADRWGLETTLSVMVLLPVIGLLLTLLVPVPERDRQQRRAGAAGRARPAET